jgi:uncharacterized protein
MSLENVALVQGLYAAFGRGDVETILETLTPDVEWEMVGRPADYPMFGKRQGVKSAADFFRYLGENEEFKVFTPESVHADGDVVFVTGRSVYTFRTTGKAVDSDWAHLFVVRGGKIARFREFIDTAQIVEAARA